MRSTLKILMFLLGLALVPLADFGQAPGTASYVSNKPGPGLFTLTANGKATPLIVSGNEYPGVKRAVNSLIKDIQTVSKASPALMTKVIKGTKQIVLVGTLGKNALIDQLVTEKKFNATSLKGKWETHITQVIENPFPGVSRALVIAGSDKRGTIFGIYDLSAQIGVSPWYWWADVPVKPQSDIYIKPGIYTDGEPAVKYRGIFINDEAPAFSGWTKEKFGGVNHQVYEKMFELILRLKGNYLWPAMWGNAFNDDDKLDPVLADEYGVVMGTSHHEPMDRAQQEWKRYGTGDWNYATNKTVLQDFWRKGIQNMGTKETIVTIGMRGDGDKPMTEGSNVDLLENIVKDQRDIISQVTGKPASAVPQMWALYKEVQDYYDKGMRVPDDVTLLLCDDNWGDIRKLPKLGETPHKGGYGIYYHFDYVGGPRNYKWLNTNTISKTWEQMHLAYEYNARQIWIVNVGDLKPMEYPISFFLDYAWAPDKWPASRLNDYATMWATQQFGSVNAPAIAQILTTYTRYNDRRKPELLDQNTYSLTNYHEFETVVNDYDNLRTEAENIYAKIPANYKDAYYELVLHPVQACANLNEMYYEAAKNKWYAVQGRAATNTTALKVTQLFDKDKEISNYYNTVLAGGKWNHIMDQTHIGYTYWQQPPVDKMPAVMEINLPVAASMGISVEGSTNWWPMEKLVAALPTFYPNGGEHYLDIFNRGKNTFNYAIESDAKYVTIKPKAGSVTEEQRIEVNIDWAKAPIGLSKVPVTIKGANEAVTVEISIDNKPNTAGGYAEHNGYIAIEAEHFSNAINKGTVKWMVIPSYGRTLSGMMPSPVTAAKQQPGGNSPRLEYNISLKDTGTVSLEAYLSPTIDFKNQKGLYYAVSMDNEQPQMVNINSDTSDRTWNKEVAENIKKITTNFHIVKPGKHILKYWMVDAGVVLQKVVINTGGLKPNYLGPPENNLQSTK